MMIGIDIGGTNTDGVLVDQEDKILSIAKTMTTDDISDGFYSVVKQLLMDARISLDDIKGISIGTTHATNALLQRKSLNRVGVIRIAGQNPEMLPVAYSWPQDLRDLVLVGSETIGGGFECCGRELSPFSDEEARKAIEKLLRRGVDSLAIVGVFSPLSKKQEERVATLVREMSGPNFPVSLSYELGGIGFIERENSTVLNASLKRVMQQGFESLQEKCERLGVNGPLMITQNDGSLIEVNQAINYPILTISAGPTNSFIGGTKLAGLSDAVVVDIGGTSTDAGIIRWGFPLRSLNKSNIGGIDLNFPMPDALSIALGGGSHIDFLEGQPMIGPKSVGKALSQKAICFGGETFTLTDAALFMGYLKIPEAKKPFISQADAIFDCVRQKIEVLVSNIQGACIDLPVILVGGGAALLPLNCFGKAFQIPPFFNVANAYGAALAEVSGTVDTVVSLGDRRNRLEELYQAAKKKAIEKGANPKSLRLVDQQILPYAYMPNKMARVIVRYCGKRRGESSVKFPF